MTELPESNEYSTRAVRAAYIGALSLALCILGPVAVVLGLLALLDIWHNPRLQGSQRALIGIGLGLLSSLGLAALILIIVKSAG